MEKTHRREMNYDLLDHNSFLPSVLFCVPEPWKHQKTYGFLMLLVGGYGRGALGSNKLKFVCRFVHLLTVNWPITHFYTPEIPPKSPGSLLISEDNGWPN